MKWTKYVLALGSDIVRAFVHQHPVDRNGPLVMDHYLFTTLEVMVCRTTDGLRAEDIMGK